MNIMIVGVSGFVGEHLYAALSESGHDVSGCSRHQPARIKWCHCSYDSDVEINNGSNAVKQWLQKLKNVDVVINTVGIYQQEKTQTFKHVNDLGPKKLFDACEKLNIKVIQISAIGAENENPVSDFLQSKKNADQYLVESSIECEILYPGIVLGERGKTTQQLCLLARQVCMPMVFSKGSEIPLISIYQLSDYVVNIIEAWGNKKISNDRIKSTGTVLVARAEAVESLLKTLKFWMRHENIKNNKKGLMSTVCFIYIPAKIIDGLFKIAPNLSIGSFNKDSIDMLKEYTGKKCHNIEDSPILDETASSSLIKYNVTQGFNKTLRIKQLYYINLITLGLIWVLSGMSSLISFEQSREINALAGLSGSIGDSFIILAAITDVLLGLFLWVPKFKRWVIYMQIMMMLIYSVIITLLVPAYWLHPFAPIIKNFAMLVMSLYLLIEEGK